MSNPRSENFVFPAPRPAITRVIEYLVRSVASTCDGLEPSVINDESMVCL
jgi:hypothetical protein